MAQPVAAPGGCRLLQLPQVPDARGSLTALEELVHVPFRFGRVRWFYDFPAGSTWPRTEPRFGDELIVALSGSFDVLVGDRGASGPVHLDRASTGLHVPAAVGWGIDNASTNSVGLVISSQPTHHPRSARTRVEDGSRDALMPDTTVEDCPLLALGRNRQGQGSMTNVIPRVDVPFEIPRIYYLYDVPGGGSRGGHAHRGLEQVLVAVAGSFDVELNDGRCDRIIRLDRSHTGAHIAPGIWRELTNFSSGAICLTLASAPYDEADYVRGYDEFRREKRRCSEA